MTYKTKRVLFKISSVLVTFLLLVAVLFSVIMITFNIVYVKSHVVGFSMLPTLNANVTDANVEGDIVYINKYGSVERGDIAVANVNWWNGSIIKRVVGLPGDSIQIVDSDNYYILYVNDSPFILNGEEYKREKTISTTGYYMHYISLLSNEDFSDIVISENGESPYIKLKDNQYFLISDNWTSESIDCMLEGPVNYTDIIGRVDIIVHVGENEIASTFKQMFALIF